MDVSQIPILNYHKIESQNDIGITSRHPNDFRNDVQFFAEQGYQTITFTDILKGNKIPVKPLILTFDDGYESVYTQAFPVLKKYNFKAVVFIPSNFIGKYNDWDVQIGNKKFRHLTSEQLEILANEGYEIAAHGCSHRPFTKMDGETLKEELSLSKIKIEEITKTGVKTICYPFGHFNNKVLKSIKNSSYQFALASLHFKKIENLHKNYALKRFNIYRFESINSIRKKLENNYNSWLGYRDWFFQLGARLTPVYQQFIKKDIYAK